jgi:hypothetical protein
MRVAMENARGSADLLVWSERAELSAYRARTNDLLYRLVAGFPADPSAGHDAGGMVKTTGGPVIGGHAPDA